MSTTTLQPAASAGPVARAGLMRRLRFLEPATLLWLLLIGVLGFLVLWPIVELLIASFTHRRTGAFTIANYLAAYGRARYVDALLNSLALGALSAAICAVLAVPMAWACSRTDMPGRGFAWFTVLAAFIIPPYLGAVGWILLAGPNSGWINQGWSWLIGTPDSTIFNVYTFTGLAVVIALHSYPFIFAKSALDLVNSEMEDAANILGAGTWTTSLKVTLPLVWPTILAGIILVFLETIALFGTPAIIGIPARINVVTTQLWQFFEAPVRAEVAAAYAMPLLLITLALIGIQRLMLARKGYVSQTGKGGERRPVKLGPFWRWALFGWCALVCLLSVVAPMIALVQASFAKAWGRGFSLDNLTVQNYAYLLFDHDAAWGAVVNTFAFSAISATAAMILALAIAYIVKRQLMPFGTALAFLCMAPFVIPGIVMAIGFYAAYAGPPLTLYGTAALMVFAFTTRFLPIAYANGAAGMQMIHPEMEEAVRILGGGRLLAIRAVVAPLLKKALLGGWLLVFILATRELSAAIFLVGPETRTISVLLYDLSEEGNLEVLSALGGILLVITLVFVGTGMKLIGRDFMLRRH